MMEYRERLRANIAAELGRHRVSQSRAANELQMSPASFGDRLQGRTDFRVGELVQLAQFLHVPFAKLTEGIDEHRDETEDSS